MFEWIIVLFFLFVLLAIATVFGHGLWVLLAWIFRGCRPKARPSRPCVYCGRKTPHQDRRCQWCGKDLGARRAAELEDIAAVERQLKRFLNAGAIKPAVFENLVGRVRRYRARLFTPRRQPEPGPALHPAAESAAGPADRSTADVVVAEIVEAPEPRSAPTEPPPPPAPPARSEPPALEPKVAAASTSPAPAPSTPPTPEPAPSKPTAPSVPVPTIPKPPRRTWGQLLDGFMEERNIRWGELVGGLLIVGSSIALVLSLWDTLSRIHYFPFLIFTVAVSAIFGAGLYSYHRWKLESTSRGLLLVGLLLVPLNYLAGGLSVDRWTVMTVLMEAASLGLFAWLIRAVVRVLMPGSGSAQVAGLLGGSAAVLAAVRSIGPESAPAWFVAVGFVPVACMAFAVGDYLRRLKDREQLDGARTGGVLSLLGVTAVTVLLAFGTLLARSGDVACTLNLLAAPLAVAAIVVLAAGLRVVVGTKHAAAMAGHHAAGTAVTVGGASLMLAALILAWPHPTGIIAVGSINAAALALVAWYHRLPVLHVGAVACATLVYLTAFHVFWPPSELSLWGHGEGLARDMFRLTFAASSGWALVLPFLALGLIAEKLARVGRNRDGAMYAGGCAAVALAGLSLVTVHGLLRTETSDVLWAATLYAAYGSGSLAMVARWRRAEFSYVGLGLLALAPVWGLWWKFDAVGPLWAMTLAVEALLLGTVAVVIEHRGKHGFEKAWTLDAGELKSLLATGTTADLFRVPLLHVAEIVAAIALALGLGTAWDARASLHDTPVVPIAAAALTALCMLMAWGDRSAARTWAGSTVLLAGLIHTLACNYTDRVEQPLLVALLAHATVAVVAAAALDVWIRAKGAPLRDCLARVFVRPLGETALLSSALVVPVLPFVDWTRLWTVSICLFWLSGIWLAVAWQRREPRLFAAHQVVVCLAALVGTAAWLEHRPWVAALSDGPLAEDLLHVASLQVFGIALGLLCLVWLAARMLLRNVKPAAALLEPPWPTVDWGLRLGLVSAQLILVAEFLPVGCVEELLPRQVADAPPCGGSGAWLLLGVLAAVFATALWHRWGRAELFGSLLLLATVPCLVAVRFAGELAVASALRFGLATAFIAGSAVVWQRTQVCRWCRARGMNIEVGPAGPTLAQGTLLTTTACVVLALTVGAATVQLFGALPSGPKTGSFFARLGPEVSYAIPLLLVLLGMVGHAIRQRSAGYAFAAGLVAELTVTLGYALAVVNGPNPKAVFGVVETVRLIQWATITAAAWAAAWLLVRRQLDVWREEPARPGARALMNVQLGMGVAGNVLLLGVALFGMIFFWPVWGRFPSARYWTAATGDGLGWFALASVVAACVYRRVQSGRRLSPSTAGLLGTAAIGLLACTIEWQVPGWGYRTLMLGWATYALFVVAATWWAASLGTQPDAQGPPQALIRSAAVWVRVAGIAAVLLGLKASALHAVWEDVLWSAASIAVASTAGATMAVWRRREGWAFSAALGGNLAASLAVWYLHRDDAGFGQWWFQLIQANAIASATVALVWLAVRKRLYQLRELSLGESPLLAAQIAIPVLCNAVVLAVPAVWLAAAPGDLSEMLSEWGQVPGWLALLATAAAAAWYLRQTLPDALPHVAGALGLGVGVLLACLTAGVVDRPDWNVRIELHTLLSAWTVAATLILGAGIGGRRLRLGRLEGGGSPATDSNVSDRAGRIVFSPSLVESWVTVIGTIVVLLSLLHAGGDPDGVWWYVGTISAVAALSGVTAMCLRNPPYVYVAGLLAHAVAWVVWPQFGPRTLVGFAHVNAIALAVGACVWLLVDLLHPRGVPHARFGGRPLPYSHLAIRVAVAVLALVVFAGVVAHALELDRMLRPIGPLDWAALAAVALAATVCVGDRTSRWALPGLYAVGLLAVGQSLCGRQLVGRPFCYSGCIELSAFALATVALGLVLVRVEPVRRMLRIAGERRSEPPDWGPTVSAAVVAAAAGLSAWIAMDAAFAEVAHRPLARLSGQWAGPLCAVMLLSTAWLVVAGCRGAWRDGWRQGTFALGLLLLCEAGFVGLASQQAPWLHRGVVVMSAAAVMAAICSFGLQQTLGRSNDWTGAGRRAVPAMASLAATMLLLVLIGEAVLFDARTGAPMALPAVVLVAAVLAALPVVCIVLALLPAQGPRAPSGAGREAYVYAAEVFAALVGLHLYLTEPKLFDWGVVEKFWMFIVMGVAVAGAGLAELFERRRLPVLSRPLANTALVLPSVPVLAAVASWLIGETRLPLWLLSAHGPALWFFVGAFYGFLAVARRSLVLGALGTILANTGLWVLWHQQGFGFVDHPQLWLIPIALAVLVAEHLDRTRLTETQRTSIRYLALSVIYVSSTTEFLRGAGQSVVLPAVLIGLSLAGVVAGMLLRVRSFLYVGVTFLTVVMVRLIYFYAVEQRHDWVFWASLILLGLAILAMFGVFEKRRNDVLAAVEKFKHWEQ